MFLNPASVRLNSPVNEVSSSAVLEAMLPEFNTVADVECPLAGVVAGQKGCFALMQGVQARKRLSAFSQTAWEILGKRDCIRVVCNAMLLRSALRGADYDRMTRTDPSTFHGHDLRSDVCQTHLALSGCCKIFKPMSQVVREECHVLCYVHEHALRLQVLQHSCNPATN